MGHQAIDIYGEPRGDSPIPLTAVRFRAVPPTVPASHLADGEEQEKTRQAHGGLFLKAERRTLPQVDQGDTVDQARSWPLRSDRQQI